MSLMMSLPVLSVIITECRSVQDWTYFPLWVLHLAHLALACGLKVHSSESSDPRGRPEEWSQPLGLPFALPSWLCH